MEFSDRISKNPRVMIGMLILKIRKRAVHIKIQDLSPENVVVFGLYQVTVRSVEIGFGNVVFHGVDGAHIETAPAKPECFLNALT
jgi:hypothetical protein